MITNPTLLYVDDDDNDILLLQTAFERAGIKHSLQVATDGQMAIDYLEGKASFADRDRYPMPSLILLDLKLPRKTGLQVLHWIRRQRRLAAIVVIILTSSPDAGDVRRAYELGANSFVVKPSDIQQLSEFARRLKDWWLGSNQFAPVHDVAEGDAVPRINS